MDTGTPQHVKEHHVHQRHFDRLVMLSDGVFAIALTLSAVELRPEALPGQTVVQVWGKPLAVYFLSFFLIGIVWMRHRRTLAHLYRVDTPITLMSLLLLSLVALVPVFVRVLLEGLSDSAANGMLIYSLSLVAIYLCLAAGWFYAAFIRHLAPSVPRVRAWGWLMEDFFVAMFFAGTALYSLQMHMLALLMALAGSAMRIGVTVFEKKAKAQEAQADGHADSQH
ncbi:TMEM175 family protein [Dyella acidiphila]|uniref:DUF1211 domain-containing protein n=1 Tax=Dyella acidiphila TaxID=2775866 RepID=A0ABR9G9W3_9GAMM|nr:TMEM175 family protein [Dyella acidiphila]MBE1160812.1 DUF1211 domain-containing protein [Dyella acidiphila]